MPNVYVEARPKGRPGGTTSMTMSSRTTPTMFSAHSKRSTKQSLGREAKGTPARRSGPGHEQQEEARSLAGGVKVYHRAGSTHHIVKYG